jgi:hypothetical protein
LHRRRSPTRTKPRPTERAFRLLEHALLMGGTQWLFVAALLATRTGVPRAVDLFVAVVGVMVTAALIVYFRRRSRALLANFADPMTGELRLPGQRLPLPRSSLACYAALPVCEVVVLLVH